MSIKAIAESMFDAVRTYVTSALDPLHERVVALESRQPERGEKGERGEPGIMGKEGARGERGEPGPAGPAGRNGLDAYEIAKSLGFSGNVYEWLDSLRGINGKDGPPGREGPIGPQGENGERGPRGEPGPNGKDGESITLDDVLPIIRDAIAAIPTPKDGAPGRDGKDGEKGEKGEKGEPGKDGKDGAPGKDGVDGRDGKSVMLDDIQPLLESMRAKWELEWERSANVRIEAIQRDADARISAAIAAIPVPKDGEPGRDGRDGTDGRSVTLADIEPLVQRAVDAIPRPKDGEPGQKGEPGERGERGEPGIKGADGRDGVDGLGFDDFDFEQIDERNAVMRFSRGDLKKEFPIKLAGLRYLGVYSMEFAYEKQDCCTYAGSLWIAEKDNPGRPGDPDSGWKLAVKKGKDGK